jgi:hypothetical protein
MKKLLNGLTLPTSMSSFADNQLERTECNILDDRISRQGDELIKKN